MASNATTEKRDPYTPTFRLSQGFSLESSLVGDGETMPIA
jgi:hypothetical protein